MTEATPSEVHILNAMDDNRPKCTKKTTDFTAHNWNLLKDALFDRQLCNCHICPLFLKLLYFQWYIYYMYIFILEVIEKNL